MKVDTHSDLLRTLARRGDGIVEQLKTVMDDMRDLASRPVLCRACGLHAPEEDRRFQALEKRVEQLTEERDHYLDELERLQEKYTEIQEKLTALEDA